MTGTDNTVDLGLGAVGLSGGCGCAGNGGEEGSGCGSGSQTCGTSLRPRWFTGQLVGPADLEALQRWVIGRARRHNRMVHGWGIACGLAVHQTISETGDLVPWSVTVSPGYALSACGDEICVTGDVRVDVRQPPPSGSDSCTPPVDPWCAPVRRRRDPDRTYYLAVRYSEQDTAPVSSTACNCGCDDNPCEYSRVRETFTLAVLDDLPDCYTDPDSNPEADIAEPVKCSSNIRKSGTRRCPECCTPWVVLADLRITAAGAVSVDQLPHRRFLASFGRYGFTCGAMSQTE